jgi:hypothetical protein
MVGVKERERERERADKAKRIYGVFQHSSGAQGGYVTRRGEKLDDGRLYFPSPYGDQTPKYVSKSEKIADRKADQLNGR